VFLLNNEALLRVLGIRKSDGKNRGNTNTLKKEVCEVLIICPRETESNQLLPNSSYLGTNVQPDRVVFIRP